MEVIQQPEHVGKKVILKPKLGESDPGTSHFCFSAFFANKTDPDMLFNQIWQYIYTKLHSFVCGPCQMDQMADTRTCSFVWIKVDISHLNSSYLSGKNVRRYSVSLPICFGYFFKVYKVEIALRTLKIGQKTLVVVCFQCLQPEQVNSELEHEWVCKRFSRNR